MRAVNVTRELCDIAVFNSDTGVAHFEAVAVMAGEVFGYVLQDTDGGTVPVINLNTGIIVTECENERQADKTLRRLEVHCAGIHWNPEPYCTGPMVRLMAKVNAVTGSDFKLHAYK